MSDTDVLRALHRTAHAYLVANEAVWDHLEMDDCQFSECDRRDGLQMSLMEREHDLRVALSQADRWAVSQSWDPAPPQEERP